MDEVLNEKVESSNSEITNEEEVNEIPEETENTSENIENEEVKGQEEFNEIGDVTLMQEEPREEVSEEDELAKMFEMDIAEIETTSNISEDLAGFANGFPDWDLHPPKDNK